jgi:hypothetical protein
MRPFLARLGSFLPLAVALGLPTAFVPVAVDEFILPRASIVIVGACLGVGLALLLSQGPGLGELRLPVVAAVVVAVMAFAFSVSWPLSLIGSYTRYESLPMRLAYIGLLVIPVFLLHEKRYRDWVITGFVFGTAIASLEALQQQFANVPFRPDGNVGNANLLGALIAMAAPLALARALRGGTFAAAWWIASAALVGGVVASTSRSGGLGAFAGCLALGVLALKGRPAFVAGIGSVLVVGLALLVIFATPLRFLNNDPGPSRTHLWPDAIHLVAARPITGWGEDTTGLVLGKFLSNDWSPGVTFDRAHSGPLDLGATEGILGIVAIGWVLFVLGRRAWRWRFFESVGPLAAAGVGYSVWVLFNFDWAPATGAFWLLAGTAWSAVRAAEVAGGQGLDSGATHKPESVDPRAAPYVVTSIGALALAVCAVYFGALPLLADVWYHQGRVDLAVVADPLQAQYHRVWGEILVAERKPQQGVTEMRLAGQLGETDPTLFVELGDTERELGNAAQARLDYLRALEIDPYFAPAQQRLSAG